ncbi:tRNA-(ms[2]io[6]A)-hydroxylase [Oculatella sp. LEGE 06141]|uniref:tRNA-(ms[2]io[6]A)-hydroxylase n=1 Tax=Oculatella sp. LEGE 06141 TaxID=1828648 RepID=UPI001880A9F2|nr:tRNA isopentenyl-2-thiomethyl-A-37 hydroxylase MiaE [Oculatella sp. LEGE 06141]MBE9178246.1 tRNA-(ms[2]io[6]A)-hydroxylase [Oculatella sp. LEGE 06141]
MPAHRLFTRQLTLSPLPTIKFLQQPTSPAWVEQAIANLDTILLDHSQCERKAAGVALNLIFRYPSSAKLVRTLTAIAQEELEHFEQVNQWLDRRGIPLAPLAPPPYGAGLRAQIRRQEPDRMLDSLLVSGLIEARSHERLGLLATHCPEPELAQFYRGLMASEARHYGIYWTLATTYFDRPLITERLEELAAIESDLLSSLHPAPRIHS